MPIPDEIVYNGQGRERQFMDGFVIPLLIKLGFGIVINYHGQREFGRDVIFGDLDRFGHIVYYGMQIKYEHNISLSLSHTLIHDAVEATNNPFQHPHSGRNDYISCFYVVNAGSISEQAKNNFFSNTIKQGIRDAKLLDGNGVVLLNKHATISRNSYKKEHLTGMLFEINHNEWTCNELQRLLRPFCENVQGAFYPIMRCRNNAFDHYLAAPFSINNLNTIDVVSYSEIARLINELVQSVDIPMSMGNYRLERCNGIGPFLSQLIQLGGTLRETITSNLTALGHLDL